MVAVAAAALWGLVGVARRLRQAAGQRPAAAVTERAGQGPIAEGDDAALKHADGAVVSPTLTERQADAEAEVLDEPVEFLPGRGIGADRFDAVHERHGLLDLGFDVRRRLAMRHPLLGVGECRLGRGQLRLQVAEPGPQGGPEFIVVLFEDSLWCLRYLLSQPLDASEHLCED